MEIVLNIITRIILQTAICSYIAISVSKIFDNKNYTKSQIILTIIISLISTVCCNLIRGVFPLSNTILSCILLFINIKIILKLPIIKSILTLITCYILTGISELLAMVITSYIFSMTAEQLLNSTYEAYILIVAQTFIAIIFVNVITYIFKNYTNFKVIIKDMNFKQSLLIALILFSCTIPQLTMFVFHEYSYPLSFI